MTLTKADLADLLFEQVGLNKREAKDMVEAFFEEIRTALETGDSVKLSGFGNFELRQKSERPGRNPNTGEEIPLTARRVTLERAFQAALNGGSQTAFAAPVTSDTLWFYHHEIGLRSLPLSDVEIDAPVETARTILKHFGFQI